MLPNGTGGGAREEYVESLRRTETAINILGAYGSFAGLPGVGVWVALEKTKTRVVSNATIVIGTMDVPDNWDNIAASLACDLAKEAIQQVIPNTAQFFEYDGNFELINGLFGGSGGAIGTVFPDSNC